MPSRDADRVLSTISQNIALARRFLGEMTPQAFAEDERTQYAVTRCLEIISEASRRLPDEMKARHPDVPWARIAGAGNIYRHDYEDVLVSLLWNTVRYELDLLDAAITRLRRHE